MTTEARFTMGQTIDPLADVPSGDPPPNGTLAELWGKREALERLARHDPRPRRPLA